VSGRAAAGTSGELSIRRATTADWPAMWPIWQAIVVASDTYVYDPATSSEAARSMWIDGPDVETWLAEADGGVVGFYKIAPNHGGAGAHIANGSYMVDAAARGRGLGRRLVQHSLRRARDAGYRGMQFNAVAESNTGAIGLYESIGFTTVGIVPGGFHHPTLGFVGLRIMFHDLGGLDDSNAG
jgi:ribosomal protein S18 acetylase RimI-like enzyme